jgi:hypothetical protein
MRFFAQSAYKLRQIKSRGHSYVCMFMSEITKIILGYM